jgi:hypothetical protein
VKSGDDHMRGKGLLVVGNVRTLVGKEQKRASESRYEEQGNHEQNVTVQLAGGLATVKRNVKMMGSERMSKGAQQLLVRMCTNTLPTYVEVFKWYRIGEGEEGQQHLRIAQEKGRNAHLRSVVEGEDGEVSDECPFCDVETPDDQGHWTTCVEMKEVWKARWIPRIAKCITRWTDTVPKKAWEMARSMFKRVQGEPGPYLWTDRCGLWGKEKMMDFEMEGKMIETKLRVEMLEIAATVWSYRMERMIHGND